MRSIHPDGTRNVCKAVLLVTFISLGACASIEPPKSLVSDDAIGSSAKAAPGLDHYAGVRDAYKKAIANPQSGKDNVVFLSEGMALVQSNCSAYFTRLGAGAQHLGFARKETSLAGGLAAAIMGLADASATAISATASAFGFTTATMDNFSDAYLFAPDIRATQDLVMSALEAQRSIGAQIISDVTGNNQSLSFTQASQFLLEMETYCQPHGIRALVTSAVNSQRVIPASEANKAALTTTTLVSRQTSETSQALVAPLKLTPERATDPSQPGGGASGSTAATPSVSLPVPVQPVSQPAPPLPALPTLSPPASQAAGPGSAEGPGASTNRAAFPAPSAMRSQSLILQNKMLQNQ
jgi:hypothetical protein